MKWIFTFLLCALASIGTAQKVVNKQFTLAVDNDILAFFRPITDRYYTNGIRFDYRKTLESSSKKHAFISRKLPVDRIIQGFHLQHDIYTPTRIALTDIRQQDRPFAGILAAGYSLKAFLKNQWQIGTQLDIGILGPSSGAEYVQTELHTKKNFTIPTGWKYQINHIPLVNLNIDVSRAFPVISNWVDFIYEGKLVLGSVYDNLSQGGTLRIGKISPLNSSGYSNGIIGTSPQKRLHELYLVAGFNLQYVFYNATIQGDHPSRELTPVNRLENWVLATKLGLNVHFKRFDIGYHYFFNTRENERADSHYFSRISAAFRI